MRLFTNMQDLSDYGLWNIGPDLYKTMLAAISMSFLPRLKFNSSFSAEI